MASLNRPGVEVTQALAETPTVNATPELVPVVVGPCFQIIDALDSSGALQADAKWAGTEDSPDYEQSALFITPSGMPDPRSNIDEVVFDNTKTKASLYHGGQLKSLERGSNGSAGSAFLKGANGSTSAAFVSEAIAGAVDMGDGGGALYTLVIQLDTFNSLSTEGETVITFKAQSYTNTQALVDEINDAMAGIASVVETNKILLQSTSVGASSRIVIKQSGALKKIFTALDGSDDHRVVGSGFQGQDDEDGDSITPWIEWFTGSYHKSVAGTGSWGVAETFAAPAAQVSHDGTVSHANSAAQTYTGTAGTLVPIVAATATGAGDELWADGVQVNDAEVIKAETSRFKMGVLNTSLSTYGTGGAVTARVYDTVEVAVPSHGIPWAPKYAYFQANNLVFGDITPAGVAATLTGAVAADSDRPAYVQSSALDATAGVSLTGLTLAYQLTEDGVAGAETTITFPAAAGHTTISDLADAISITGVAVSGPATATGRLLLTTAKSGANQSLTIKSTGTANAALGFSTSDPTTGTGKDNEYAEQAAALGSIISVKGAGNLGVHPDVPSALALAITDSIGTHTLSATPTLVPLAGTNDLFGLVATIARAFGASDGEAPATLDGAPLAGTGYAPLYDGSILVGYIGAWHHTNDAAAVAGDTSGRLKILSLEGGASVSIAVTATDKTDGFRWLGFHDPTGAQPAELAGTEIASIAAFADGATNRALQFTVDVGAGPVGGMQSGASFSAAQAGELAYLLNDKVPMQAEDGGSVAQIMYVAKVTASDKGHIIARTIPGGTGTTLASVADGAASSMSALGFAPGGDSNVGTTSVAGDPGFSDDSGADLLNGKTLEFQLDGNPKTWSLPFTSNSLRLAIDDINTVVKGAVDIASDSSDKLKLTSSFAGAASQVKTLAGTANTPLGFPDDTSDYGEGRPNPDFYIDGSGSVNIGANILRDGSTGVPFTPQSGTAPLYLEYTALRKDVTASAATPAMLTFNTTAEIEAAIGPISTENPLALAAFLTISNSPTNAISALGVDETTAAAPEGTIDGYARALDLLAAKEVYAMVPLTSDTFVQQLFSTHVQSLSLPENRGERIAFIWSPVPTRAEDTSVQSGTDADSTGSDNTITVGTNPASSVIAAGISDLTDVTVADDLYIELVIITAGSTELRRYSISTVNGSLLTLRVSFASDENLDGFYSTTELDGAAGYDDLTYAIRIRGDMLYVTGTTVIDNSLVATNAAAQGAAYGAKRVFYLFSGDVDTSVDGVVTKVPGFYACAAIAGMVGELAPQQPFTNLSMTGFSFAYDTDDTFSQTHLDTIADGGRYVLINQGGLVASRMQRSTDSTTIEKRELSITKAIDWMAKGLRSTNRVFIGKYVINPGFLDQLTMVNEGFLALSSQLGVVNSADLKSLLQDETSPDTILIEIEVAPAYPCNKIKITIIS